MFSKRVLRKSFGWKRHDYSLHCTFLEDASVSVMDKRYASGDLYESKVLTDVNGCLWRGWEKTAYSDGRNVNTDATLVHSRYIGTVLYINY